MNKSENLAKNLFEEKAGEFDDKIPLLIPYYNEIYDILLDSIPFERQEALNILDIGCGTGTFAGIIKQEFPLAKITCVDFAENMIKIARSKLREHGNDIDFYVGDFNEYKAGLQYDLIVSCYALHHIPSNEEKARLYENIYNSLTPNGIFLTADIVLGANQHIEKLNTEKWAEFLNRNFSQEIIEAELIKYQAGDHPSSLSSHYKWMENAGFIEIETIWKYYSFTVFGGKKLIKGGETNGISN